MKTTFNTKTFLALACDSFRDGSGIINPDHFVSKKTDPELNTCNTVLGMLADGVTPSEASLEVADKIIAMANDPDSHGGDFDSKVFNNCRRETNTTGGAGFLAYAPVLYFRKRADQLARSYGAANLEGKYPAGSVQDVCGTVTDLRTVNNGYGRSFIIKLDVQGNTFSWFSKHRVAIGDTLDVRGTVKGVRVWRGACEVNMNRVKVIGG